MNYVFIQTIIRTKLKSQAHAHIRTHIYIVLNKSA